MPMKVTRPSTRILNPATLEPSGAAYQLRLEMERAVTTEGWDWKETAYELGFHDDVADNIKTTICKSWQAADEAYKAAKYSMALTQLDALWTACQAAFSAIQQAAARRSQWWHGDTMSYGNLPNADARQFVLAMLRGTAVAAVPGTCHDRGKHNTDPVNNNAQQPGGWAHVHEWDIGGDAGYRATVWKKNQQVHVFWSSHHGLNQYSYELVTNVP